LEAAGIILAAFFLLISGNTQQAVNACTIATFFEAVLRAEPA
jgi:hypothetical protein